MLPIMISVMVAKWVGDAFGKEGIYHTWIALRNYPWIPSNEYRDKGETAASILVPFDDLVTIGAEGLTTQHLSTSNYFNDRSSTYRGSTAARVAIENPRLPWLSGTCS